MFYAEDRLIMWCLILALLLMTAFIFKKKQSLTLIPNIAFPDLSSFVNKAPVLKERLSGLPNQLKYLALILFLCAFLDPYISDMEAKSEEKDPYVDEARVPSEGLAIYLVLDQSGSMSQKVTLIKDARHQMRLTRMELLKALTKRFIKGDSALQLSGRNNDLIGLVSFARKAEIISPLTLDHEHLVRELENIQVVDKQDKDGTAIGYAILKTANIIAASQQFAKELIEEGKPSYEIKNTVIILFTDGLQGTHPEDREHRYRSISILEAAKEAQEKGIKMYLINIEPRILLPRFHQEKEELRLASEITGGKFYVADRPEALAEIYAEINGLEKNLLPKDQIVRAEIHEIRQEKAHPYSRSLSFYPYLIGLALASLFVAVTLETTYLRRIP